MARERTWFRSGLCPTGSSQHSSEAITTATSRSKSKSRARGGNLRSRKMTNRITGLPGMKPMPTVSGYGRTGTNINGWYPADFHWLRPVFCKHCRSQERRITLNGRAIRVTKTNIHCSTLQTGSSALKDTNLRLRPRSSDAWAKHPECRQYI